MDPGRTVARLISMTFAPAGIGTLAAGPTAVIRSPWISTGRLASIWPDFGSNNLPARTTGLQTLRPKHGGSTQHADDNLMERE